MTNERKIEVLDCARVLIDLGIENYICLAIAECLTDYELNEIGSGKFAIKLFGDSFTKYKPENCINIWFPLKLYSKEQAKEKRIEILDKMIAELKTLEQ